MKVIDELIYYLNHEKLLSKDDIQSLKNLGYYVGYSDPSDYQYPSYADSRSPQEIEWEADYWAEPERPQEPKHRSRSKPHNSTAKKPSANSPKKAALAAELKKLRNENPAALDGFSELIPDTDEPIDQVIAQLLTFCKSVLKERLTLAFTRNSASFSSIIEAVTASYHQRIPLAYTGPATIAYRALQQDLKGNKSSKYGWVLSEPEISLAVNIQHLQWRLASHLRELARDDLDLFHQKIKPFSPQIYWFLSLLISANSNITLPQLSPARSHALPMIEPLFWLLRLTLVTAELPEVESQCRPHIPLMLRAIRNLKGETQTDINDKLELYALDVWDADCRPASIFLPPPV